MPVRQQLDGVRYGVREQLDGARKQLAKNSISLTEVHAKRKSLSERPYS